MIQRLKKWEFSFVGLGIMIAINLIYFFSPMGNHLWLAVLLSGPLAVMMITMDFILNRIIPKLDNETEK
jgi:hypothetical protein